MVLLEARDRAGGRVWSHRELGFAVDLGASWLHGATADNPLTPLVSEFSCATVHDPADTNCRYDKVGGDSQVVAGGLGVWQGGYLS